MTSISDSILRGQEHEGRLLVSPTEVARGLPCAVETFVDGLRTGGVWRAGCDARVASLASEGKSRVDDLSSSPNP